MSKALSFAELNQLLIDTARAHGTAEDVKVCAATLDATNSFFKSTAGVFTTAAGAALESFGATVIMNAEAQVGQAVSVTAVESLVNDAQVPNDHRNTVMFQVMALLNNRGQRADDHLVPARPDDKRVPMIDAVGAAAFNALRYDQQVALEAFGQNIDVVSPDIRTNIVLTLLRPHKSIVDRVLPRIPQEQNTFTIKVPSPEAYNLHKSMNADPKVRNGDHRKPMIALYRDPSPVSTEPKRILLRSANDSDNVLLSEQPKVGKAMNLFSLAMNNSVVGLNAVDWTDLVSEGGRVKTLFLQVVKGGGSPVTEIFAIPVAYAAGARFIATVNTEDSGDRSANLANVPYILKTGMKTSAGATSSILADFTDHAVKVEVSLNVNLNLKTSDLSSNGSVGKTSVSNVDGTAASTDANTAFAALTFSLVAFEPEVYRSEENLRMTDQAVRVNYSAKQYEIPVGRSLVIDYSMQDQPTPEDVVTVANNMQALGNDHRGLTVLESVLNEVYAQQEYEKANPGTVVASLNKQFIAGTLCNPIVIKDTIDFGDADLAVMRESERLSELHSRVIQRLLSVDASLAHDSLYDVSLNAGERRVIKVIAGSYIADVLLGIPHYHNVLNGEEKLEKEGTRVSDVSFFLPNGTRVDVVKTVIDSWASKMLAMYVREEDPKHPTSVAAIHERGTFVGQYTAQPQGAVTKRIVMNSREIPIVTNPVAAIFTVVNLDQHVFVSA